MPKGKGRGLSGRRLNNYLDKVVGDRNYKLREQARRAEQHQRMPDTQETNQQPVLRNGFWYQPDEDCDACEGTGVCPTCEGEGHVEDEHRSEQQKCRACYVSAGSNSSSKGTGICRTCRGERIKPVPPPRD